MSMDTSGSRWGLLAGVPGSAPRRDRPMEVDPLGADGIMIIISYYIIG